MQIVLAALVVKIRAKGNDVGLDGFARGVYSAPKSLTLAAAPQGVVTCGFMTVYVLWRNQLF